MNKLLTSLVCFALVAALATAGGDKAGNLNGTWVVTAVSVGNKKAPKEFFSDLMPYGTFKDGKYALYTKGQLDEAGTYKVDAAKQPASIDLTITEGKDKGKLQLGIYKLDGDTLLLAVSQPGVKLRPKNFDPNDEVELQVMKRKK